MHDEDEPINEYRVKVTVRNNLILKAIDDAGYNSVAAFCRAVKCHNTAMTNLISFREPPLTKTGEFSKMAKLLMEELCALPTELWTAEQLTLKVRSNTVSKELSLDGMRAALGINSEEALQLITATDPAAAHIQQETATIVGDALDSLTPREAKLLRMRFGIGCEEHTLEEAGKKFEVSRERIRQIEVNALRKLKHPTRTRVLRELIERL